MEKLIDRVRDYINSRGLMKQGDRVLLSLSAGKDSLFLFHSIMALRNELGVGIGIFHLNHMMRGAESDHDEDFIRAMGERHGIETHLERHDFSLKRGHGVSFEEDARNVRYRLLDQIAESGNYTVIATAHSRDDQVETVIMRVLAGTGIHGLRGMAPRRGRIVRPLLAVTAAEIYEYLREHAIEWREDASNADLSYSRNFVRNRVLPCARERFPMADDSIMSLSEVADETISLLDDMIQKQYGSLVEMEGEDVFIDAEALKHSFPLFAHVVSSLIRQKFNHHVNRTMLQELHSKFLIDRANISLYADKKIRAEKLFRGNKSWLRLSGPGTEVGPVPEWEYTLKEIGEEDHILELAEIGISITIKPADYAFFEKYHKNKSYIFVTLENNDDLLYIRNRREGDVIRTRQGAKKIKELFIDKKLTNAGKNRVPLLLAGETVIACMTGFLFEIPNRIAPDFLVDKNSKKVIAVIKN